ncbi:MAG: NAD-dependent epimerase/dehydratase family protein [Chloroflexi bacterium]|nr:MAG: NAD-dependent epimerase/dehydratase family protein [Chloroflexota bacterium]TMD55554.1 MAG: NAD-dependent epimerase/dehydratase family protein [Chloroflexota bacterium]
MILVTGATGFIGSRLLKRLAGGSEPLRGSSRSVRAEDLPAGVEAVPADVTKPETLGKCLAGVGTVVHAAAITANLKEPYRGGYDRINRAGTENLVKAAQEAGVKRLVLLSGLVQPPVKEGSYMATRVAMEDAVRGSGIPHLILQPSVLFGDGAEFVSALAGVARWSPALPLLGPPRMLFQPLWVEDLLRCLEASVREDRHLGETLPLGGGEYVTFRQVLETICKAAGRRRLLLPLPMPIARLQAALMSALLSRPPLTPATLELFAFDNTTELDSVERSFGFKPRGFREHLLANGLS